MVGAAALIALGAVSVAMVLDGGAASVARHLFLIPVGWLAVVRGSSAGVIAGILAGLLQAPMILPVIEREGLHGRALDGCAAMALPLAAGLVLGHLADQSRGRASRLRALLAIQQTLSPDAFAVDDQLALVAGEVRKALGVRRVAIVLGAEAGARAVASEPASAHFEPQCPAAWTASCGEPLLFADMDTDARLAAAGDAGSPTPTRGLVLPLSAAGRVAGALAIETRGDLTAAVRAGAEELAMHLGLALENARLALLQRQFAEQLEERVAWATRGLRELDRAKSDFISVVSHELRSPLTALQGFAELLLVREVEAERARRWLEHIHGEAQRLARIVEDLLDVSRIERGGGLELRREPVDVGEVVARNVDLFAAAHPGHRFATMGCGGGPVLVPGDADAIDRIVKNLLSNAVKYSPRGGAVRVSLGAVSEEPAAIEIAVEDEGVGIPPEALPRIFDKYVRVSDPATAAVRGLGLGLSLVRALADAHGGHVSAESRPGQGSRFAVRLPV